MEQIEFIKAEIKDELERAKERLEDRVMAKDYAGALKKEGEIEALMRAWNIVCNSQTFK
jgi:hypothetical protein